MKTTITLLLVLFTSIATFGQTTETRYYNGRYDYDNGLSSKEVVLHKINSYINIKNKAGATFLNLEEKPDFLSGTWTIKSSQGDIVIALDYLVGDKSLTVKLKYITVGSNPIIKGKSDNDNKIYNVAIENFILDLFKYLEIKNNTTSKQTTSTTTGSNTSKQTNVQNEIAEKQGASFNSSLPLYVKEVSNGVYYFYQKDKRIQDPKYHQPTSGYANKGIKCYYRTNEDYYFYVHDTEKPNTNGKYPMFRLRGRYIYTTISNDEQKFVFEGKTLKPQEYDLIVSREKNSVLLLKEKGLMFEISSIAFPKQNETATHAFSNSDALGSNSNIFIVFKENGQMVVAEKGKIQPKTNWKITKENDRNFLINNVNGRKYRVGIYNLAKTGIVHPQFINLVQ
ncbi:hypothetical protein COR50_11850 [Chitinophaga caeni]|uniref:Uncharacterized protein n=1 Tax=Chitinophaga caeni TaxID=2029983 RepID=A0A291QVA7_9BACT|nr:hypothetical protein [Chitinophaga caeni]ATL47803.1 hypothetical protein COR50_11850 [Chitinophaga caeni]